MGFGSLTSLTGTAEFSAADKKKVYGTGTAFTTEVKPGDLILNYTDDLYVLTEDFFAVIGIVKSIEDDEELTLVFDFQGTTGTGKNARIYPCNEGVDIAADLIDISGE
jgi:hypothetical protein